MVIGRGSRVRFPSALLIAGGVFLLILLPLASGICRNYDLAGQRTTPPLIGTVIQLVGDRQNGGTLRSERHDDKNDCFVRTGRSLSLPVKENLEYEFSENC